jgi:hypothetical protein
MDRSTASAAAIPFLAELAADPYMHARDLLLDVVGRMATSEDGTDATVRAVRAALDAEVPRLLPLLADDDPAVRESAAYALGQCRDRADRIVPRLWDQWMVEDVAEVRASLLAAAGRLDPAGSAGWLDDALASWRTSRFDLPSQIAGSGGCRRQPGSVGSAGDEG